MRVEEILTRELREVADSLSVPALPPLPQQSLRARRRWQPLLAAAAVVLVAAGAVAGVLAYLDSRGTTSPAPPVAPSPTESPTQPPTDTPTEAPAATPTEAAAAEPPTARPLGDDAPKVPFVFDESLYVAGNQLSGHWGAVNHANGTWAARRNDDTWWWGTNAEPHPVPGQVIGRVHISPDGTLLAFIVLDGGQVVLLDPRTGETVNTLWLGTNSVADDMGRPRSDLLGVDAVTDDAKVLLSSETERVMWLAGEGDEIVDLATAAPNQWVWGNTPAGLLVQDGESDATYLAEISDSGMLTRLHTLPGYRAVNPSGTWLAYGGSWGGESQTIDEITAQTVDGSRQVTLRPPDGRSLLAMTWEDDDLLLAGLYTDVITGLARCSISEERCWVIDVP